MKYVLMPFVAWVAAGCLKFLINTVRSGKLAFNLIGYGGFPSTHTTVASSVAFLAGFTEGFDTPIFSIGLGFLIIVIIDAHGLRHVGSQAKVLNRLQDFENLRERMGHTYFEIAGGIIFGALLAVIFANTNF